MLIDQVKAVYDLKHADVEKAIRIAGKDIKDALSPLIKEIFEKTLDL